MLLWLGWLLLGYLVGLIWSSWSNCVSWVWLVEVRSLACVGLDGMVKFVRMDWVGRVVLVRLYWSGWVSRVGLDWSGLDGLVSLVSFGLVNLVWFVLLGCSGLVWVGKRLGWLLLRSFLSWLFFMCFKNALGGVK